LSDASTGGPGDDLVICAEVPGLEQDDIDISIENNTLVLRGERKRKTEFEEVGCTG
jgi:HSP20 family protein